MVFAAVKFGAADGQTLEPVDSHVQGQFEREWHEYRGFFASQCFQSHSETTRCEGRFTPYERVRVHHPRQGFYGFVEHHHR